MRPAVGPGAVRSAGAACAEVAMQALLSTPPLALATFAFCIAVLLVERIALVWLRGAAAPALLTPFVFWLAISSALGAFWLLNALLIPAAVVGDSVGYAIGARIGPRLFTREKSVLFNPKHVERTRQFYERHGAKTIVIARFVPIVRTFAPVVAGVGQMRYRRFLFYNVAGGVGWVVGMTWTGFLLGHAIPDINRYIHVVVGVVIVLSVIPIGIEILRARRRRSTSS
jgi:membrane-associated protein